MFSQNKESIIVFASVLLFTFAVTVLILRRLIPYLKSMKMGQVILDIGPRWHKSKEGTPTMGGLSFIWASLAAVILYFVAAFVLRGFDIDLLGGRGVALALTYGMALLSGLIGMIDDRAKLRKKQNEGLTAPQKFFLQILLAGGYVFLMSITGNMSTRLYIPFIGKSFELGIFYYLFAIVLIAGIFNSVNLNDGIDGLCSSMSAIVGIFFAYAGFCLGSCDDLLLPALTVGGCLGFLVYNFHPARVFMGDTGSLFLGGLLVGMAFYINDPLIIVVCGFVYIFETISVIIQVGYFKLTHGKRFFKMAPIHHHFEKCGWSEVQIVIVFSLVTAVLCVLSAFGI